MLPPRLPHNSKTRPLPVDRAARAVPAVMEGTIKPLDRLQLKNIRHRIKRSPLRLQAALKVIARD
jgi:hypothetical protein